MESKILMDERNCTGRKPTRNGFIELCRFIFAMCIVSHHALFFPNHGNIPVIGGYIGVEFFFILTGYFLFASSQKEEGDHRDTAINAAVKRIKKVYPYFLVSWGVSFLLSHIVNDQMYIRDLLWDLLRGIPQLLLLSMAGLGGSSEGLWDYVGTGWYLSAMLLTILLVYPLMRRGRKTFSAAIAPVIVIYGYGYIIFEYNFLGVVNERLPFCYLGCIRALAGICLGSFCFCIVQSIPKYRLSKIGKATVSIVQIGVLLLILRLMKYGGGYNDLIQVILFSVLIIVSLSFESYLNELCTCRISKALGISGYIQYGNFCYAKPDVYVSRPALSGQLGLVLRSVHWICVGILTGELSAGGGAEKAGAEAAYSEMADCGRENLLTDCIPLERKICCEQKRSVRF